MGAGNFTVSSPQAYGHERIFSLAAADRCIFHCRRRRIWRVRPVADIRGPTRAGKPTSKAAAHPRYAGSKARANHARPTARPDHARPTDNAAADEPSDARFAACATRPATKSAADTDHAWPTTSCAGSAACSNAARCATRANRSGPAARSDPDNGTIPDQLDDPGSHRGLSRDVSSDAESCTG